MSSRKTSQSLHTRPIRAKALISQLRKEQNPLKMKMLLLGYITDRLEKKSESVFLVGGQAVETYTGGQFLTGDIDITTTDRPSTERILESIGFKEIGMIWLNEQLGVAVHIVDMFPHYLEKTRTIKTGPYKVRVIGIEDLIVDRLSAAKFWNSSGDMEKAMVLLASFKKQIDENYLRKAAKKSRIEDILAKARVPISIKPRASTVRRTSGIDKGRARDIEKIQKASREIDRIRVKVGRVAGYDSTKIIRRYRDRRKP